MQGVVREHNVYAYPRTASAQATETANANMTPEELRTELEMREQLLQRLHDQDEVWTGQWRVYSEIREALQNP